ncbi:MAG: hypothetical protein ED559_14050 [Phycisphaera sp.]|nr:MAG: hypothetical protein ED559_14050 [Phycisphaera sp.]
MKRCVSAGVCALIAGGALAQPITRLGAIGDSLSDEYAEEGYGSYSMSWSEILVTERGIDMGPTASDAGVGDWGEPRRSGYEDNWARFGHTTDDAIATGQHTGAAAGITGRGVSHVVVFLGGNDFGPAHGPYADVYNDSWSQSQIDTYVNQQLAKAETVLDEIDGLGAKILVVNLFDFGAMVSVERNFPDAAGRQRASALYDDFSDGIEDLAMQRGLPVLDMLSLSRAIFGTHDEDFNNLGIAGVNIRLNVKGDGSRPDRAYVDDGTHPKSTIQGIWCNAIITALNDAYNTGITPLSETEILGLLGLSAAGPDELDARLGSLSDYVIVPPANDCLPDTNGDGSLTPADFTAWINAFNNNLLECDQNGDGACTPTDFTAWISNFNAGCL